MVACRQAQKFVIADQAGHFDPHGTKIWEVSQHCCDIQRDMQKEGAVYGDIAYAIHKFQVEQGMQKYIFHRPGHGEASEGHYAPYIALGDRTVLKKNSVFSEEPGRYDPDTGVGRETVVPGRLIRAPAGSGMMAQAKRASGTRDRSCERGFFGWWRC